MLNALRCACSRLLSDDGIKEILDSLLVRLRLVCGDIRVGAQIGNQLLDVRIGGIGQGSLQLWVAADGGNLGLKLIRGLYQFCLRLYRLFGLFGLFGSDAVVIVVILARCHQEATAEEGSQHCECFLFHHNFIMYKWILQADEG